MAGGLLNLIAIGNQNIILNGNPSKSFFKSTYAKYTNFGLQKYRVDQTGQQSLNKNIETIYSFKIPRYAELLMDTYLVLTLPNIYSPVFKYNHPDNPGTFEYRPYEFQWIKNLGTQIIKQVVITIGGVEIQKFSGHYLQNMIERDYDYNKKQIFDMMTGNISELNDPANYANRNNKYPNAFKINDGSNNSIEPSIHSHRLYIPIHGWYSFLNSTALPLICLQYAELKFTVYLRPIQELFTIKDVIYDMSLNEHNVTNYNDIPRIKPTQTEDKYAYYRFINEPPFRDISSSTIYPNNNEIINYDIHMITTQCFLDTAERTYFAKNTQEYLIKTVHEYNNEKISKSSKFKLESNGLVSNWMWFFQRNDVSKRNEWTNYTNWAYENVIPNNLKKLTDPINSSTEVYYPLNNVYETTTNDISNVIYITGYVPESNEDTNHKEILKDFGIYCDGKYREESHNAGIYNKIEKYTKTHGNYKDGLYHYSFSLNNDITKYQPNGAFNTNKFKTIEFEYNLVSNPPFDLSNVDFRTICDPETGEIIATSKEPTSIYKYNYDLHIMEERYNILKFQSGLAELMYGN